MLLLSPMTARRAQDFDLDLALVAPSFTPRRGDIPALLDRVAGAADSAALAERALVRVSEPAVTALMQRLGTPDEPAARVRLLRLGGKLAAHAPGDALIACLAASLADADERVRRAAATALGKVRDHDVGGVLAGALATESSASVQRALIEALGKAGGEDALALLDQHARAPARRPGRRPARRPGRRPDGESDRARPRPRPADGRSHRASRATVGHRQRARA